MYVNGTAGTQDNSAPPIATAPAWVEWRPPVASRRRASRRSELSCSIRSTRPKSSGG